MPLLKNLAVFEHKNCTTVKLKKPNTYWAILYLLLCHSVKSTQTYLQRRLSNSSRRTWHNRRASLSAPDSAVHLYLIIFSKSNAQSLDREVTLTKQRQQPLIHTVRFWQCPAPGWFHHHYHLDQSDHNASHCVQVKHPHMTWPELPTWWTGRSLAKYAASITFKVPTTLWDIKYLDLQSVWSQEVMCFY